MKRLLFVLTLALIAAGVLAFYQQAALSTRGGEDAPLYSMSRHDPYGIAALADLLAQRGVTIRAIEQPVPTAADTDPGKPAVLLQVISSAGAGRAWFQDEQLVNWITQGNTVIQLSRVPTDLMNKLHISATTLPTSEVQDVERLETIGANPDRGALEVARAHTLAPAQLRTLYLWTPMKLIKPKGSDWTSLARLAKDDSLVAGSYRVGTGKLILIAAPTPALNGLIGQEENLDFLLDIIGSGPVIIDESAHGLVREPTIINFIHDVGLLPLVFQIAFIALLYVWSTSGHTVPPRPPHSPRRSSLEQVQMLGYLYSRSFNAAATAQRVNTEVKRRLTEALRGKVALPPALKAEHDQLLQRAQRASSVSETAGLLTGSFEFTREVQRERNAR